MFDAEDKGDFTQMNKMSIINAFLKQHKIPIGLRRRINNYYLHIWRQKNYSINSTDSLLHKLHPSLAMELNLFLHKHLIGRVSLFQHIENIECIILILEMIKMRVCIPQEAVAYQGEMGAELYIIVKGLVSVIMSLPNGATTQLATLKDGDMFGERSLVYNEVRNATVKCITFTELLVLEKIDFLIIAKSYPTLFNAVMIEINAKATPELWNPVKEKVKGSALQKIALVSQPGGGAAHTRKQSVTNSGQKRKSIIMKIEGGDSPESHGRKGSLLLTNSPGAAPQRKISVIEANGLPSDTKRKSIISVKTHSSEDKSPGVAARGISKPGFGGYKGTRLAPISNPSAPREINPSDVKHLAKDFTSMEIQAAIKENVKKLSQISKRDEKKEEVKEEKKISMFSSHTKAAKSSEEVTQSPKAFSMRGRSISPSKSVDSGGSSSPSGRASSGFKKKSSYERGMFDASPNSSPGSSPPSSVESGYRGLGDSTAQVQNATSRSLYDSIDGGGLSKEESIERILRAPKGKGDK